MYSKKALEKNYLRYVSKFLRDYNYILTENNMNIVESIEEMYCNGDFTLFADLPELAPVSKLRPNERYIGPITGKIKKFLSPETEEAIAKIKKVKDTSNSLIVYLSLGSLGNYEVLKNCFCVLSEINAKVFITAAEEVIDELPENVYMYKYLYVDYILPFIDLAITNGGSGANYQAYEHNVKLIALPSNVDQLLSCSMIEIQNAGIVITRNNANDFDTLLDAVLKISNFKREER